MSFNALMSVLVANSPYYIYKLGGRTRLIRKMLDDDVVRYRILLSGQNLLAEVEGSLQYLGFYTTRTVEAGTEAEAESLALDLIRRDKKLLQMMRNKADDPPTFLIEEIVETVDESEARNTGFAFYLDTKM